MALKLAAYLDRIGFRGTPRADLATLRALHAAHQYSVPFENLDVQLRRPVGLELASIYDKIVSQRRGGWCYELNGLMGWALQEIGFDVMRVSAGVMRALRGETTMGTHLCLLVQLDQPYLVDVGFGGSLAEPLALRVGEREDRPYRLALRRIAAGYWQYVEETSDGEPFTFDFLTAPADEALLARQCELQQTSPESGFVKSLVVQRRSAATHVGLRGRVLKTTHASHTEKSLLRSGEELVTTIREKFDLDVPEAASLWPAILARHEEMFGPAP